jgi:hypothetical protein
MATDLLTVAQAITYPDLRRRLLSAYHWDSAGENPNTHGDPWTERKLAAKLASYDEPAFIHLMHNIVADTYLTGQGSQDLTEYAIRLRSWAAADTTSDPMRRQCELVPGPSQQTSQHPHAS